MEDPKFVQEVNQHVLNNGQLISDVAQLLVMEMDLPSENKVSPVTALHLTPPPLLRRCWTSAAFGNSIDRLSSSSLHAIRAKGNWFCSTPPSRHVLSAELRFPWQTSALQYGSLDFDACSELLQQVHEKRRLVASQLREKQNRSSTDDSPSSEQLPSAAPTVGGLVKKSGNSRPVFKKPSSGSLLGLDKLAQKKREMQGGLVHVLARYRWGFSYCLCWTEEQSSSKRLKSDAALMSFDMDEPEPLQATPLPVDKDENVS